MHHQKKTLHRPDRPQNSGRSHNSPSPCPASLVYISPKSPKDQTRSTPAHSSQWQPVSIPKPLSESQLTAAAPTDRRPIIISGPSGVGKGTLYNRLFAQHPDAFCLSVSHTTRSPRVGETDGVDYHYVTMETFEDLIAKDGFVEHAKFGGNRYGTSKMTIEEQTKKGRVVLLDIEMEVRAQSLREWDAEEGGAY